MREIFLAVAVTVVFPAFLLGQNSGSSPQEPTVHGASVKAASLQSVSPQAASLQKIDAAFVNSQFGDQFTLVPEVPPAFGDLDGDGVQDVVIAARCKNALLDQASKKYRVIDPYNEYFGFGDPRMTTTFAEGDPSLRGLVTLIIHGSGPEAWRSAEPKAKYVVVNLPFKSISVRKLEVSKKRTIDALYVEEGGDTGISSAVFFDAKKMHYHYLPMGGDMQ